MNSRILRISIYSILVVLVFCGFTYLGYNIGLRNATQEDSLTGWDSNNDFLDTELIDSKESSSELASAIEKNQSFLKLSNVRFRWTKTRFIETENLTLKAIPRKGSILNLDNPDSFYFHILNGKVALSFDTMEEIFNQTVFDYPGTNLRSIRLHPILINDEYGIQLQGDMRLGVWIGFRMDCIVRVERNRILLIPKKISALGIPFVIGALDLVKIPLEYLLPIQKGRGAELEGSTVVVNPYLLFRSPSIIGSLRSVAIRDRNVIVGFAHPLRINPPMDESKIPKNHILLWNGNVKLGRLTMEDANIRMMDTDPRNVFDFYLKYYKRSLSAGQAKILDDGSVMVDMPDFFE